MSCVSFCWRNSIWNITGIVEFQKKIEKRGKKTKDRRYEADIFNVEPILCPFVRSLLFFLPFFDCSSDAHARKRRPISIKANELSFGIYQISVITFFVYSILIRSSDIFLNFQVSALSAQNWEKSLRRLSDEFQLNRNICSIFSPSHLPGIGIKNKLRRNV